jgi:transcriptional activator of cad operon
VPVIWCTGAGTAGSAAETGASGGAPAAGGAVAATEGEGVSACILTTALVWGLFLLALGTCVALVALSSMESRPPVNRW